MIKKRGLLRLGQCVRKEGIFKPTGVDQCLHKAEATYKQNIAVTAKQFQTL